MTSYILLDREFILSDDAKATLEKYINRIEKSIDKYQQSEDEKNDIFLRICEKLEQVNNQGEIKIPSILRIMNEIGEPEEIFSDANEQRKTPSSEPKITKDDIKDFFQREFHRNQKEGLILGVCVGMGETFSINPIWIRLLFVITTLTYGTGIIVYLLLAILLPDISRSKKGIETQQKQKIETQTEEVAEDIRTRVQEYGKGRAGIISRIFDILTRLIVFIFVIVGILIRFVFFGMIAGGLFGIAVGLVSVSALISSNLIIDMQSLFSYFPNHVMWIFGIGGAAAIILGFIALMKAFGRSSGNNWLIIVCLLIGTLTFGASVQTFMIVAPHYANEYTKTAETTFPVASGSTVSMDFSKLETAQKSNFHIHLDTPRIIFSKSKDDQIHVFHESTIRAGSEKEGEQILGKVTSMKTAFSGSTLWVAEENKNSFSEVVPFAFLIRTIRISLPENTTIVVPDMTLSRYTRRYGYENLEPSEAMFLRGIYDCQGLKAHYDTKSKIFVCQDDLLENQK